MAILTLTDYKEIKNITSSNKDSEFTQTIQAVNSFIPSYCNRYFTEYYATDKVEYFDGVNNKEIYPDVFPLVSVTSVKTSSDAGQTYDTILEEYSNYIVDLQSSRIISTDDSFAIVNIPTNSLEVTYKAGFVKVPDDLKLAAAHLVEYFIEEQYTPKKAFSGVSVENISILDNSANLPAHIRRVLEHYRAVVL